MNDAIIGIIILLSRYDRKQTGTGYIIFYAMERNEYTGNFYNI